MPLPSLPDSRLWLPEGISKLTPRPGGEYLLYWIQTTQRAEDNFALEFAIEQADALGVPVLAYFSLRPDYPWASDRFHTFMLQGVVDMAAGFAERGIQFVHFLDQREQGGGVDHHANLKALAARAAMVVTDWFPTFIMPRQLRQLRDSVAAPVVAVDSACVVPAQSLGKAYSGARHIRPALMEHLDNWLQPVPRSTPAVTTRIELPFDQTIVTPETIPALVAGCPIDHTVPPAIGWTGGSRAAEQRLEWWLEHGLPRYHERNDPNVDATSRLSPYFHFGQLSVHRALLAARDAGCPEQYATFLDETLTWRELAFNLCRFDPRHRTTSAIPEWARKELANGEADPREALYTDQELEQARTGSELWNAAQRSYLHHGWMHNYMRMLWGKSVISWTDNAAEALRLLEHLNNKYSLDGRDPCTYGGILWCFGKFDRPFYRRPIYGTVRYMSLKAAKGKFDVGRYVESMGGAAEGGERER